MDDVELHERIIMLDQGALAAWEAAHRGALVGWLLRGGLTTSDADEVWNDTFAATINAAPNLVPRGVALRRYAFRVARNLRADRIAEHHRRGAVPLDVEPEESDPYARLPVPDPRRVEALKVCLDRCPERYRVVIELGEEGRDVEELAAILGIDPGSVYQVRSRARKWLQTCIAETVR